MADVQHYDTVIIGSGQAAIPLLTALAAAGRKAALVERDQLGGSCINFGCTPTKTMVASARMAYLAGRSGDYGVQTGTVKTDLARVRERKRSVVADMVEGRESAVKSAKGADLLRGEARFIDAKTLEVRLNAGGAQRISADIIVIDTGTQSSKPDLEGLDSVDWLTSTSIMELDELPDHLLILGGGYIGLEFGQMFRRFGSKVTIVQRGAQLMGREDEDVAEEVAKILREDGIDVRLETAAVRVGRGAKGGVELTVSNSGKEETLSGSHLLVAVGRTPNTAALHPDAAGIELDDKGYIKVDNKLATNVPGIYAAGDVNGGPQFTHISYDDYRILCDNLIKGGNSTTDGRMLPYVAFIDPQFARVGLSEQQARKEGRNIKVAKIPMSWVARAIEVDETRGLMKAVVDADTEQILGCAILGLEGGEIMAMIEIAMLGKLRYPVLRDGIFAHPTLSEALNTLFTYFED